METLFLKHDLYYKSTSTNIVREQIDSIDWDDRLIAIVGPKGVGKSTLLRQYIKLHYPEHSRKALYCSLDSLYFSSHRLIDLITDFVAIGGERLFLDEIHKYKGPWSSELKESYDLYPQLKIVISGSSLLKILNCEADLSRRCVIYHMQGLSYREYLSFYHNIHFPKVCLESILENPHSLSDAVMEKCHPLEFFHDYFKYGYYPFYLEGRFSYYTRIEQVVTYTLEVEMPELHLVDIAGVRKLKKMMSIISEEVPFSLNSNKLANAIGATRETVVLYLHQMGRARLLNLLFSGAKDYAKLAKPDKLYLENTNMLYALCVREPEIGTVRETFAVTHLSVDHQLEYGKDHGDFKVDGKYIFEVGGADKGFGQIAQINNSFVLADDIESPIGNRIPLWMIGFIY